MKSLSWDQTNLIYSYWFNHVAIQPEDPEWRLSIVHASFFNCRVHFSACRQKPEQDFCFLTASFSCHLCFCHSCKGWCLVKESERWHLHPLHPPKTRDFEFETLSCARQTAQLQGRQHLLISTRSCLLGVDDPYEEQTEDPENPLRCPIKLYDFYLFKW